METWKASLFDNKPLTDRRPDQSSGALKGKRLSVLGHWLYFFCEQKKNILLFTKRPRLNRTSEHTVTKYWTHWLGIQLLALWGISEAKVAKKLHDTSLAAKYFWCFGVIKMWQQSIHCGSDTAGGCSEDLFICHCEWQGICIKTVMTWCWLDIKYLPLLLKW